MALGDYCPVWLFLPYRESGERETVKEKERKDGAGEGGGRRKTRDNMLQAPGQTVHESQIVLEVNKRIKKGKTMRK